VDKLFYFRLNIKIMDRSIKVLFTIIFVITLMFSCKPGKNKDEVMKTTDYKEGSFGYDLKLLKESDENLVVLTNNNGKSQVIVSAKYQGKVFTSTAEGLSGNSFGWINHELIKSGEIAEHMNAYGSEDRLWFGPEGGQYSIFFEPEFQWILKIGSPLLQLILKAGNLFPIQTPRPV